MSRLVVHDEAATSAGRSRPQPGRGLPPVDDRAARAVLAGHAQAHVTVAPPLPEEWLMGTVVPPVSALGRGQHPAARHAHHRHQRARQRLVRGARLRRPRPAGAVAGPARPRLPAGARHAVLPDGVGAEVLHLGRGDQPADPGQRPVRRERDRPRRHRRLPGRPRAARDRPLRPGRLLRRAPRARLPPGRDRVCRGASCSSAPSARPASTSAPTSRSTCSAAGSPVRRCSRSSSPSTSSASTSAPTSASSPAPARAPRRVAVPLRGRGVAAAAPKASAPNEPVEG